VSFSVSEVSYLWWLLALVLIAVYYFHSRGLERRSQALQIFAKIFLIASLAFHVLGGFLWPVSKAEQDDFIEQFAMVLFNREIEQNPGLQDSRGKKNIRSKNDLREFQAKYKAWYRGELIHDNKFDFLSGGLNLVQLALDDAGYLVSISYELDDRNFTAHATMTPSGSEFEYERSNREK
jgi:hypothetical protein